MASLLRLKAGCFYKLITLLPTKNIKFINKNLFSHIKCVQHSHKLLFQSYFRTMSTQLNLTKKEDSQLKFYNFDRAIFKMDMELKRIGRILRVDVDDLFKQVKRSGDINSIHGLMLFRCCGDVLVENTASQRMQLLETILKYFKEKDFIFDVSHYNALLKVYLDNEHNFKPEEFVAEMVKNNVEPNRVTYQRLIAHFCQIGDTNGAGKVLEIMKQKGYPVNEDIFNSLIVGHFRANDLDGVAQVLELMHASNLALSEFTYSTLLSCYAERGDWENIQRIFKELADKKMKLVDNELLRISEKLAFNGHKQYLPEVLSCLSKTSGFNQDIYNSIIRLVNKNELDIAYNLLQNMIRPTSESVFNSGNFFIRQMIRTNQDLDKIIYYCTKMEEENINSFALSRATETAAQENNAELLFGLLNAISEKNRPMRPHYFWPLLSYHRTNNNKQGILNTLAAILEHCGKADSDTFIDYAFPAFESLSPEEIIMDLKNIGYSTSYIVNSLVTFFVNQQDFKEVLEILDKFQVNYVPSLIIPALSRQCHSINNIPLIVQILAFVLPRTEKTMEHSKLDFAGQFLLDSFFLNNQDISILTAVLEEMINQKISLSSSAIEILQRRLKEAASPEIMKLIEQLTLNPKQLPSTSADDEDLPPHPRLMTVEDLESHLIELKSKNMNTRGVLRRLFIEHCRQQNTNRVLEIKEELDSDGFEYSSGMLALLMDMYANLNDLEKALEIKAEIEAKFSNFVVDDFKIINLATCLMKNDQFDDAVQLLISHREKFGNPSNQISLNRCLVQLLTIVSDKSIDKTRQVLDIILQNNYSEPTNPIYGPLIKALLLKNDISAAISEFEDCINKHKLTPMKNELFKKLVEIEDLENLQKVMNLSTAVHGQINTMHDLAFTFIELGHIKQAKKVFDTPGLRAFNGKLAKQCTWWLSINKADFIEQLVNITKDVFDIDRNALYQFLLQGYRKMEDPQKALALWTAMQEENLQPTAEFLQYLARILKDHQIPIPFSVPKTIEMEVKKIPEDELKNLIKENKCEEALILAQKMQNEDKVLNLTLASSLIELLIKHEKITDAIKMTEKLLDNKLHPRIPVLKSLMNKLSLNGDHYMLKYLQKKLPDKIFAKIRLETHIDFALVNSNNEEELLKNWENEETQGRIRRGSMLYLIDKKPETLPRVEKVVDKMVSSGLHYGAGILWQYYMLKDQFDKALDVIKKFPELAGKLQISHVCVKARSDNKEDLLTKVIDMMRITKNSHNLAFAYSYLIGLQCSNKKYSDALETLKQIENDNLSLEDLIYECLATLKKELEINGQTVPFELPRPTKKQTEETESDSD